MSFDGRVGQRHERDAVARVFTSPVPDRLVLAVLAEGVEHGDDDVRLAPARAPGCSRPCRCRRFGSGRRCHRSRCRSAEGGSQGVLVGSGVAGEHPRGVFGRAKGGLDGRVADRAGGELHPLGEGVFARAGQEAPSPRLEQSAPVARRRPGAPTAAPAGRATRSMGSASANTRDSRSCSMPGPARAGRARRVDHARVAAGRDSLDDPVAEGDQVRSGARGHAVEVGSGGLRPPVDQGAPDVVERRAAGGPTGPERFERRAAAVRATVREGEVGADEGDRVASQVLREREG